MSQTEPVNTQKEFKRNMQKMIFNTNTLIVVLIAFALAIVINLLAARYNYRLDLTKNKMYTLSDQTIQALKDYNKQGQPIKILGFFATGDPNGETVKELLKRYQKESSKITVEYIDPNRNPAATKQYQVTNFNTLILVMGEQQLKLEPSDLYQQSYETGESKFVGEQALTRSLYQLIDVTVNNVYMMSGHGEKSLMQAETYLMNQGLKMKYINLLKDGKIPSDCSELIIPGPQSDFSPAEVKFLEEYLAGGGRVMILMDYNPQKPALSNLKAFIRSWGIEVTNNVVFDLKGANAFGATNIIPEYVTHLITKPLLQGNMNLILPVNLALRQVEPSPSEVTVSPLLQSSENSWAESNPTGKTVEQNSGETKGPIPLGFAATRLFNFEATQKEARLIVVGTSLFLDSNFIGQAGNLNFFYNSTQWLLGKDDRVSIITKESDITRVPLTPIQVGLIRLLALIILPVLILGLGTFIWLRRRAR